MADIWTVDSTGNATAAGNITSNGHFIGDGSQLTGITAAQVGAVPTSEVGQANGVASLDTNGKVPLSELPSLAYVPTSEVGQANGVASLDTNGLVPVTEIPQLNYIPTSAKGTANGVATLDANTLVPSAQLPAATTTSMGAVEIGSGIQVTNGTISSNAASVGAVSTSVVGQAGGVASLDSSGHVPVGQIPSLNYVPLSAEGAANGVSTLDSTGNVPSSQLANAVLASEVAQANGVASLDNTGNVPASQLHNVPPVNTATSNSAGTVEVAETPASGTPVVPTCVASFQETEITSTSATQVLAYTPQANHNFQLQIYLRVVTSTTNVTIKVTYTDAGGNETYYVFNNQLMPIGQWIAPLVGFNATTGSAIIVSVTSGTSNQIYVSGTLLAI